MIDDQRIMLIMTSRTVRDDRRTAKQKMTVLCM